MSFEKITEAESHHHHLETLSSLQLLLAMNDEDLSVPLAVKKVIPFIEVLVEAVVDKMMSGGRLFYIGAGTSGRLGVLDASECPPTFGVPPELVNGIIAGGAAALTGAVEKAEDDAKQGWLDLRAKNISSLDIVIGITASGTTPYVLGALTTCREMGISTGSICCNPEAPVSKLADFPVEVITGPEFVTASTRLKSGTAQKLILNMISTAVMVRLGRVKGNKMVDMQLTNEKLVIRGIQMIIQATGLSDFEAAKALLIRHGSVRKAIEAFFR